MTREDLQRQHDEVLTATRDEYNQHIAQLQHSVKVCVECDSDNISEFYLIRKIAE